MAPWRHVTPDNTRPVWQGVSTDSQNFYPGPLCQTLLRFVGRPPPKRPFGRFGGGPPTGWAACGRLLPPWIPLSVWVCITPWRHFTLHSATSTPVTPAPSLLGRANSRPTGGEFLDQGDAKWIENRGQLRGHNHIPFGRRTPGRPIGRPMVGRPQGIFSGLRLLLIINILF
jgi:hypothetical protein